jgi:hypothetical protein
MNLLSATAPLIRLAAADEYHAYELFDAFDSERRGRDRDERVLTSLVYEPAVQEDDLAALTPPEWQWYASWRQALGGRLDRVVLDYLTDSASTRFARYEVHALVLRDPQTNEFVRGDNPPVDAIGLNWLSDQAQGKRVEKMIEAQRVRRARAREANARVEEPIDEDSARIEEALELTQDALQCATDASTFLLTQLRSLPGEPGESVNAYLEAAENRRVRSSEITTNWYERGTEVVGG